MEIGLALPQYDFSVPGQSPLEWQSVMGWADRAVALGFSSLWVSDHLFLSLEKYGGPPVRYNCLDPTIVMGSLAVRHPQATVGCLVFCAQLRAPRLLAKQLETLDVLAPGRVVAGLGAGWYEPEFEAAGIAFERPGVRLGQMVDAATQVREFLSARSGGGAVPLWFGGKGDRLVELAARHADGWNTVWAWTPQEYAGKLDVIDRVCTETGRDRSELTLSVGLTTLVGTDEADLRQRWRRRVETAPGGMFDREDFDEWRRSRLVGTVEEVREQVATWRTLGVRLLIANLGAVPFSVTDTDDLDLVASALL